MRRCVTLAAGLAGLAATLAGCRSLGYNNQSVTNTLTPGIDEQQYVRTWGPDKGGGASQTVVQTTPSAATSDPAYPNYTGPAKPAPAPAAPPSTPATR